MTAGFSWRRGLLAGAPIAALTIGYFAWLRRSAPSPEAALRGWWVIALLVLGEIVLSLGTSYLSQTGRKEIAKLVSVGAALALLGGVWWYGHRPGSTVFTDEERAAFVIGEQRLVHPTLGFSVLNPGPGFVATGSQAFRSNAQFYVFTDRAAGEALTIGLFKGQGDSAHSLRELVYSMAGQASALAGGSGARVRVVQLDVPETDPPRGDLHAIIGAGKHYRLRAYGWNRPGKAPIAVMIAILSSSPDAHADVLASFQP